MLLSDMPLTSLALIWHISVLLLALAPTELLAAAAGALTSLRRCTLKFLSSAV